MLRDGLGNECPPVLRVLALFLQPDDALLDGFPHTLHSGSCQLLDAGLDLFPDAGELGVQFP